MLQARRCFQDPKGKSLNPAKQRVRLECRQMLYKTRLTVRTETPYIFLRDPSWFVSTEWTPRLCFSKVYLSSPDVPSLLRTKTRARVCLSMIRAKMLLSNSPALYEIVGTSSDNQVCPFRPRNVPNSLSVGWRAKRAFRKRNGFHDG